MRWTLSIVELVEQRVQVTFGFAAATAFESDCLLFCEELSGTSLEAPIVMMSRRLSSTPSPHDSKEQTVEVTRVASHNVAHTEKSHNVRQRDRLSRSRIPTAARGASAETDSSVTSPLQGCLPGCTLRSLEVLNSVGHHASSG